MPISEQKIAANRRNAQKSAGPITASGKAASRANALKHGLYSNKIVIQSNDLSENPAEYELLVSSLREELCPETVLQECLVRKIANCVWRSRRVVDAESAHIQGEIDDLDDTVHAFRLIAACRARFVGQELSDLTEEEEADLRARIASRQLVPDKSYTLDLTRYEMRLDRQLIRMYQFYQDLKVLGAQKSIGKPDPVESKKEKTNPPIDSPATT